MPRLARKSHPHQGWPDSPCRYRSSRKRGSGPCGLPQGAAVHTKYPCSICGLIRYSIDARMMHTEQAHPHLRKVGERA